MKIRVYPKSSQPFNTNCRGDKDDIVELLGREDYALVGEDVAILCNEIVRIDFLEDEVDGEEE